MNYSQNDEYAELRYIYNGETTDNAVTEYLNTWYKQNIADRGFDSYVKVTSFCNDSSSFKNGRNTYFNGYARLVTNKEPSLLCPATNNDFGGTYVQKVGLITADEVALAGGLYDSSNTSYYLYNSESFATMTPADYLPNGYLLKADIFIVDNSGALKTASPTTEIGIRPVISLDPSLTVSGSGTIDNPYTIDLDD